MNGLPDQAFPTEENRPMHSTSKGFEPALDISPEKRASIQDFVASLADWSGTVFSLGLLPVKPTNRPESSHPRAMNNEGYNYAHAWLKLLVQDSAPMKFSRP